MATAKDAYRTAMREDLLGAAERVLARKGVAGITIRDILHEAGVAPGTLYAYFPGKDAILEAMAQRALVQYVAGVTTIDDRTDAAIFGSLVADAFTQPLEGASVIADIRGRALDPEQASAVRLFNHDLVATLRPVVERALDDNQSVVADVDALLELLDIVWDGLSRRSATETFVTSYERVGSLALELLRTAGVMPPAAPPLPPPSPAPRSPRSPR